MSAESLVVDGITIHVNSEADPEWTPYEAAGGIDSAPLYTEFDSPENATCSTGVAIDRYGCIYLDACVAKEPWFIPAEDIAPLVAAIGALQKAQAIHQRSDA